jgi:hypothetical protein
MINWDKPIRVKDSHRAARLICSDRKTPKGYKTTYVVLVLMDDDREVAIMYDEDGRAPSWQLYALENIPEERYVWINIYKGHETHYCFASKEDADYNAKYVNTTYERIGCMKVKLEERFDE